MSNCNKVSGDDPQCCFYFFCGVLRQVFIYLQCGLLHIRDFNLDIQGGPKVELQLALRHTYLAVTLQTVIPGMVMFCGERMVMFQEGH